MDQGSGQLSYMRHCVEVKLSWCWFGSFYICILLSPIWEYRVIQHCVIGCLTAETCDQQILRLTCGTSSRLTRLCELCSFVYTSFICVYWFYFVIIFTSNKCNVIEIQNGLWRQMIGWILIYWNMPPSPVMLAVEPWASYTMPYDKLFYVHEKADSSSKPA